jgi:histone-lysine N-methyltransferase SETMAR
MTDSKQTSPEKMWGARKVLQYGATVVARCDKFKHAETGSNLHCSRQDNLWVSAAPELSSSSKTKYCAILRYKFARGLSVDQCLEEMAPVLGDDCPHRTTIFRWYREFQRGNFSLEEAPMSGCPASSVTEEHIAAVRKMLESNRHVTYRQKQECLYLPASALHIILHDHLQMRKVCFLWLPHALTDKQKAGCISWCHEMLSKFKNGVSRYVNRILTGDETWLYFYDMPTKAQNKVWDFEDENMLVSVQKSRSMKKRMATVFFTVRGVAECMVLQTQKTVAAKWYSEECLPRVFQVVKNMSIHPRSTAGMWFFHNNAPAHQSKICTEYAPSTGLKVLKHPPYRPDLTPCNFTLFPYVKNRLKGRWFSNDKDLLRAWDEECAHIPEETWKSWFDDWFQRMQKCIECGRKYFESL